MKILQGNYLRILIIFLLIFTTVLNTSAENTLREKLTLISGKVFYGEVMLSNSDFVVIKLDDGSRFQFTTSEVKSIEPVLESIVTDSAELEQKPAIISGVLDISGGICFAKNKMSIVPFSQINLIFGSHKFDYETVFLGLGVGYNMAFLPDASQTLSFIPLFIRFRKDLKTNIISPFMSVDLGYAFGTNVAYSGGAYSKLIIGFKRKLDHQTSINLGLFAGAQSFSGELSESINNTNFAYYGESSLINFGLNFGLNF